MKVRLHDKQIDIGNVAIWQNKEKKVSFKTSRQVCLFTVEGC